jgi:PRC-barrel domain
MGMVVDVLVDRDGKVRAAVIDFGGFLGVGSRKIAIDWNLVQFNPDNRDAPIVLALNQTQLQAAPEYKPAPQVTRIVAPPLPPDRSATAGE